MKDGPEKACRRGLQLLALQKKFMSSTVGATIETSVSNKSEKWAEAFVLGWGLHLRWAEAGLCLRRAEVPERGALLSDKIIRQRLRVEGR